MYLMYIYNYILLFTWEDITKNDTAVHMFTLCLDAMVNVSFITFRHRCLWNIRGSFSYYGATRELT